MHVTWSATGHQEQLCTILTRPCQSLPPMASLPAAGKASAVQGMTLLCCWVRLDFQAAVLGALSVLLVDRSCRVPFIKLEPACATLFTLW